MQPAIVSSAFEVVLGCAMTRSCFVAPTAKAPELTRRGLLPFTAPSTHGKTTSTGVVEDSVSPVPKIPTPFRPQQ